MLRRSARGYVASVLLWLEISCEERSPLACNTYGNFRTPLVAEGSRNILATRPTEDRTSRSARSFDHGCVRDGLVCESERFVLRSTALQRAASMSWVNFQFATFAELADICPRT